MTLYTSGVVKTVTNSTFRKLKSFTRKANSTHFNYYVSDVLILRSDCMKHLGVMLVNCTVIVSLSLHVLRH
jgi:hypothetical protein